eukprot:Skav236375  [mRNA]  locus=scaffold4518:49975:51038:+ [translate_table: standard]
MSWLDSSGRVVEALEDGFLNQYAWGYDQDGAHKVELEQVEKEQCLGGVAGLKNSNLKELQIGNVVLEPVKNSTRYKRTRPGDSRDKPELIEKGICVLDLAILKVKERSFC